LFLIRQFLNILWNLEFFEFFEFLDHWIRLRVAGLGSSGDGLGGEDTGEGGQEAKDGDAPRGIE
jgi:hypothetical protein